MSDILVDRVRQIITRYSMLSTGDSVGVGVSGGADSVVLLHLLRELAVESGSRLIVLHVNHKLRGPESAADEAFVRDLAIRLRLDCRVHEAPIGEGNLEQEARQARQTFFEYCRAELGMDRIALGHSRSDQAETLLFRFLRGSGLTGLAGMRPRTENGLIRPLLTTGGSEIRQWAAARGITWREDTSNADTKFARNKLRNEVIPALARDFNTNLEGVLAATAAVAAEEEDFWNLYIAGIYARIAKRTQLGSFLQIAELAGLHVAEQRRLIRYAIADLKGDLRSIDREHVEAILAVCRSRHGHDRVIVPGIDAFRSFDSLLLSREGELPSRTRQYHLELKLESVCRLPFDAGSLTLNLLSPTDDNCDSVKKDKEITAEIADLEGEALAGSVGPLNLFVRNWQPGDELQRRGHTGAEKIKALFQEQRILLWDRRHWPVVVSGKEVVWTRQFGAAAKFTVSGDGRSIFRLTYRRAAE